MTTKYNFLILADLHGNIKALKSILNSIDIKNIDALLIAGDLPVTTPKSLIIHYAITHGNLNREGYSNWVYKGKGRRVFVKKQLESIYEIEKILKNLDKKILYVPGNVDTIEAINYLKESKIITLVNNPELNNKISVNEKIDVIGIGSSLIHIGEGICDGELTEKEYNDNLARITEYIEENSPSIILSHEPPYFEKNQKIKTQRGKKGLYKYEFKKEGGSLALLELIRIKKPLLVVSGHYHEYFGSTKINSIDCINPGCAAIYQYATVNIEFKDNSVKSIDIKYYIAKKKKLDFISTMYGQRDSHKIKN